MDLGIGLPSTIPTATGRDVLDWANAADAAGFASVGTLDRVVYGNHETIPILAAAAAVTSRARLTTAVLLGPFRGNGALLAKQLATVDSLSNGRLTVGIAVGARQDDFQVTGSDYARRGAVFDGQLAEFRDVWSAAARGVEDAIGPAPVQPGGPPILIGGMGAPAIRRAVQYGAGWIAGGGRPSIFAGGAEKVRRGWTEAGREGSPRLASLAYFALGPDADALAEGYLRHYYGFAGEYADTVVAGALTSESALRDTLDQFEQAGCGELVLFPCAPDLDQLHRLAELTLG
jgi:alkanesulfonate monooxygenase SsuD/methylene tetrahydromethanopterin reductase-like flavin-dependent oxidoreductase (luciferase family)